jgi:hypothetical protein
MQYLKYLILGIFLFPKIGFCQNNFEHEFLGVLFLNNDHSKMISYRLVFEEKNGKISGYSITDLDGDHETKNIISGVYDRKSNIFSFKEEDILYTKSSYEENSFCYINFEGNLKKIESKSRLEGNFTGTFKNKKKCIDGKLNLLGAAKVFERLSKIDTKIQKSKRIAPEVKEKTQMAKSLDSLKINKLSKDENLNVFWKSAKAKFSIWDSGKEDGDIVTIYHNEKVILNKYKITNSKKVFEVEINEGLNTFKIIALNEGEIAPNTVNIEIKDNERVFELMSNLKAGESSKITIIKK